MFKTFLRCAACLSLLTAGCAQTVEVTSSVPKTQASSRFHRIAVLNVDGPKEFADMATQRLIQRLRQSGTYQVVDEQELQQAVQEPLRDENGTLRKHVAGQAGRRMQLDALLVSSLRTRDSRKEARLRFGHPAVSAAAMYTWVDLPGGRIRGSHQAQHAEAVTGGGNDSLQICIEKSVDTLTEKLAPNLQVVTFQLSGNRWFGDLSEGNRLAAEYKWQAAEASWNEVVREDPYNAAAWFNLGVAAEARGDYRLARDRYRRAKGHEGQDSYRTALARVEDALQRQQVAKRPAPRLAVSKRPQHVPRRPNQQAAYESQRLAEQRR